MVEAHGQVATLIKAEYTEEDLKVIKILEPAQLKTYLDSLA